MNACKFEIEIFDVEGAHDNTVKLLFNSACAEGMDRVLKKYYGKTFKLLRITEFESCITRVRKTICVVAKGIIDSFTSEVIEYYYRYQTGIYWDDGRNTEYGRE